MNISDVRRQAFRRLIDEAYGGVARQLALACKKPEGQINDMLSSPPRKSFGEKIAREIERNLGLPGLHLDQTTEAEERPPTLLRLGQPTAIYKPDTIAQVVEIMRTMEANEQLEVLGAARVIQFESRRHHLDLENRLG